MVTMSTRIVLLALIVAGAAPIRYGQPPPTMETMYGPAPLNHGQQYEVLLVVRDFVVVGQAVFVP